MDAISSFTPTPGQIYLDSATYGLAPTPAAAAIRRAVERWSSGAGDWIDEWDRPAESCRAAFATLAGVTQDGVALLPAVSVGVGLVAAGLGPGDDVVVPADEFESVLFPLLVAERRGAAVRRVPFDELAGAIRPSTTLVAFSLVQMQSGRRADLAAILGRASEVGARAVVDATQAIPFLDPTEELSAADVVVCAGYKHLLCPRGAAFMYVRADARDRIEPLLANWRAQDEPYANYFGGPLVLASGGARFDVSLAWLPWVGAVESLRLLVDWKNAGELDRVRTLSRRLASGLGLESPPPSTLVCWPTDDVEAARRTLRAAGIRASVRATSVRLAPHVYTTDQEVDAAVDALTRHTTVTATA